MGDHGQVLGATFPPGTRSSTGVVRVLAGVGILGAIALLVILILGTVDWGPPGSASYRTYELANRLMGIAMAATVLAPIALRLAHGASSPGRVARVGLWLTTIGMVGMACGSAAEFWLFSNSPYQGAGSEGRNIAWTGFLVGGLVLLIGTVVTGIGLLRRGVVPRWASAAVLLAPPVGIATTIAGAPLLMCVPLCVLAMGVGALALLPGSSSRL